MKGKGSKVPILLAETAAQQYNIFGRRPPIHYIGKAYDRNKIYKKKRSAGVSHNNRAGAFRFIIYDYNFFFYIFSRRPFQKQNKSPRCVAIVIYTAAAAGKPVYVIQINSYML